MKNVLLRIILSSILGAMLAPLAFAQNCKNSGFNWSNTDPAVNVEHIFCGEIKSNGKVVGFHSVQYLDSAPVSNVSVTKTYGNGIYNATVTFINGKTKMSTFYPDACSYDQIVNSVLYANSNPQGNTAPWGRWGWSADGNLTPKQNQDKCLDSNKKPFKIRMALPDEDGDINTAFPYMQ